MTTLNFSFTPSLIKTTSIRHRMDALEYFKRFIPEIYFRILETDTVDQLSKLVISKIILGKIFTPASTEYRVLVEFVDSQEKYAFSLSHEQAVYFADKVKQTPVDFEETTN